MVDTAQSTIVGPSILINGNLQGDEDLTVLGRVEGAIRLTKTLNVEESGIVKAEIAVRNAVVSGVVVGNITATDSVEITEAGRMVGDIRAPRVIIVDGARFRGAVDMGDLEAPRASAPLPARTVDRAALARTASTRPVTPSAPALPARRPPPPPPSAPRPAPVAVSRPATPAPLPKPAAAEVVTKPSVPVSAPQPSVPVSAPQPSAKKFKKRVVVKKKS